MAETVAVSRDLSFAKNVNAKTAITRLRATRASWKLKKSVERQLGRETRIVMTKTTTPVAIGVIIFT